MMVRWLADENFNNNILRGLFRERGDISTSFAAEDAGLTDDILLLSKCRHPGEWEGQVRYLPLR